MNASGSLSLMELAGLRVDEPLENRLLKIRKGFADNLKRAMTRRAVTVGELATKLGVTPSLVSSWRTGKYLPMRYLEDLCSALKVQPAELFIDPSNPTFTDMTGDDALEALAHSMGYGIVELKKR